jgi:hypothetical protein
MKRIKLLKRTSLLVSTFAIGALLIGCASPHRQLRRIYLHEYSPTVSKVDASKKSPLQGVTVSIKDFTEAFDFNAPVEDRNIVEPQGYRFSNIATNAAQKKMWDRDGQTRIYSSNRHDFEQIGYVRNIFGNKIGGVYATIPPSVWLGETLKMDLANQGAQIVGGEDATVVIQGTIRHLNVDMCFKYWADLIVDVEITVKGRPAVKRTIHTIPSEHTAAGSGSSFEFFKSFRQCQQKFSAAMIDELESVLEQQNGSGK